MRKILAIGWKEIQHVIYDPVALLLMLGTPFALTLVIAFAFGGSGGSSGGLSDIPLIVVNQDEGEFGSSLLDVLTGEDLANLLEPVEMSDPAAARSAVENGAAAVAVLIPQELSTALLPAGGSQGGLAALSEPAAAQVVVYADPAAPISTGVVRSIVESYFHQVYTGVAAGQVTIEQLLDTGRLDPAMAQAFGQQIGQQSAELSGQSRQVLVQTESASGEAQTGFDWLTYSAPSMAILFLMFTVAAGGRKILAELEAGTLPRLLVTPTRASQVLGGKVLGIYASGLFQMGVLFLGSFLLLGVSWGAPLPVAVLVLVLVAAATSWGILIAAIARTPGEANAMGTAISLVFAVAAGNFIPRQTLPEWLQLASRISPNAWGLEGLEVIRAGSGLLELAPTLAGLTVMAIVLFTIAVIAFRRRFRMTSSQAGRPAAAVDGGA